MATRISKAKYKPGDEKQTLAAQIFDTSLALIAFFLYSAIMPTGTLPLFFQHGDHFGSHGANFAYTGISTFTKFILKNKKVNSKVIDHDEIWDIINFIMTR